MSKLEDVSHETLVLLRPRVSSRVSGFPLASPYLWGKLQNLSLVSGFCLSSGVTVSMGEAAKPAKPRLFCCAHVAVSMVEAAKPQSLFVIWRRRVFGGSCKAYLVSSFCLSSGVAVSMGKAAKPRLFCCAHVAVSMGEAAKPRVCASFVVNGSTGTCLYKLCSTQCWVKALSCLR